MPLRRRQETVLEEDGNKRTGRLIGNALLIAGGAFILRTK